MTRNDQRFFVMEHHAMIIIGLSMTKVRHIHTTLKFIMKKILPYSTL